MDNAWLAYARFQEIFSGKRWDKLAQAGARVQRPLWASTGTKNPAYPDTLYVDSLIAPDTVNTVPPATLEAFMDHGQVTPMTDTDLEGARARMVTLAAAGVNLETITQTLLDEGLVAFAKAFENLMGSIAGKREQILAQGHLGADMPTE